MSIDLDTLSRWIGQTQTLHDTATVAPLRALSATLDRDPASVDVTFAVPPCWHWLYFLPMHPQSEIGPDGHPRRGGFLPPVPLPRRMWAGSRIEFLQPIQPGQALRRDSHIADITHKVGRRGALVFVSVHHAIYANDVLAIREVHDIVYREAPKPDEPRPEGQLATEQADWSRQIVPDDVLLFRYSALTFNGHRIHYDRRYVTEVEGYPGLIVHGPLIATLLLEGLHQAHPKAQVRHFAFKALQPLFDTAPFTVCGRRESAKRFALWAITPKGELAMQAHAEVE